MDAKLMQFKKGMIILWSGPVETIPGGWALCSGDGDTPDLRNKFIVGAGDTYSPTDVGGLASHTHDGETEDHDHTIPVGTGLAAGTDRGLVTGSAYSNFSTGPSDSRPPYYALCYIMKL